MKMKLTREFYIPKDARISKETAQGVVYNYEKDGPKFFSLAFTGKQSKPTYHYYYTSEEQRTNKENDFFKSLENIEKRKALRKAERTIPHSLKVGDILYTSWGYEQTNIDFYQVTKIVGGHSVQIREIAKTTVRSEGSADYVAPIKNAFRSEPETKRVSYDNHIKIASYASAWLWDGRPQYQTAVGFGH